VTQRIPIRARLTLVFSALMTLVLAGAAVLYYAGYKSDLDRFIDERLVARAETLRAQLAETPRTGVAREKGGSIEAFSQVVFPDGSAVATSPGLRNTPFLDAADALRIDRRTFFERVVSTDDGPIEARLLVLPSPSHVVVVGTSLESRSEALRGLSVKLALGGAGMLMITTVMGWLLVGAAFRPVERMRAEAAAILPGRRGRRLPVPGRRDEIARLAQTLNDMLERLEDAFERERRFVDDASHELRTPLGILKTELDLALRRARSSDELEAALESAAEESNRLNRLADDLLVLARANQGQLPIRRSPVDLPSFVDDVMASFQQSAADARIRLSRSVSNATPVTIDRDRLTQALGNLISNAIRHSHPGGRVMVSASSGSRMVSLTVEDEGEGFPADFLHRAFQPFARARDGKSDDGGAGLGLAIVNAIAEAHGGRATVANRPEGGARVRLQIPL
jgi:two-component system OmpR family sensor kinase